MGEHDRVEIRNAVTPTLISPMTISQELGADIVAIRCHCGDHLNVRTHLVELICRGCGLIHRVR
ncbi:TPA: hypothetical protein DF272_02420 [Candidatus Falkowbacteria bacterium]|nr:hypothetical protein [Candidatus Falkowbacteria bacterium]